MTVMAVSTEERESSGRGLGHTSSWKGNGGLWRGLTGWHVSVWKLSLPQDLEEDAQLSDKGEEVGMPCSARGI